MAGAATGERLTLAQAVAFVLREAPPGVFPERARRSEALAFLRAEHEREPLDLAAAGWPVVALPPGARLAWDHPDALHFLALYAGEGRAARPVTLAMDDLRRRLADAPRRLSETEQKRQAQDARAAAEADERAAGMARVREWLAGIPAALHRQAAKAEGARAAHEAELEAQLRAGAEPAPPAPRRPNRPGPAPRATTVAARQVVREAVAREDVRHLDHPARAAILAAARKAADAAFAALPEGEKSMDDSTLRTIFRAEVNDHTRRKPG